MNKTTEIPLPLCEGRDEDGNDYFPDNDELPFSDIDSYHDSVIDCNDDDGWVPWRNVPLVVKISLHDLIEALPCEPHVDTPFVGIDEDGDGYYYRNGDIFDSANGIYYDDPDDVDEKTFPDPRSFYPTHLQ